MGDDEKLIDDIVSAAEDLKPKFIDVAGTPIPTMTGFDFAAVAEIIKERTGIPAFGFATTGMNTYVHGVSMALEALAKTCVDSSAAKSTDRTANILGLTPLDFSVNGSDTAIAKFLEDAGYRVVSKWAMGSSLEEIAQAGSAHVNLVVSSAGLAAAKELKKQFGTPYVVGVPVGAELSDMLRKALDEATATGENKLPCSNMEGGDIVIVGESVTSLSLASALELSLRKSARVLCTTECFEDVLRSKDTACTWEEEIENALIGAAFVIADPLFKPICPEGVKFIELPSESFSGRIYRDRIPNLVTGFSQFFSEVF